MFIVGEGWGNLVSGFYCLIFYFDIFYVDCVKVDFVGWIIVVIIMDGLSVVLEFLCWCVVVDVE